MARTVLLISVIVVVAMGVAVWWLRPILDRHEGTAAWLQAVGAIVIIFATAWIANRSSWEAQERENAAKRQLWESIAALARNCLDAIDNFVKNYPKAPTSDWKGDLLRAYEPSDFDVPIDGLAAVPLHQVGDANLIMAVLTLRGIMGRIQKHLDAVLQSAVIMAVNIENVRNQRTQAFNAVASVLRIVEGASAEEEISRLAGRL